MFEERKVFIVIGSEEVLCEGVKLGASVKVTMYVCVVSLGELGLTWEDVPGHLKEKLLDRLDDLLFSVKFNIIAMNGCINGLNTMGYDWKNNKKVYESMLRKIEGLYEYKTKIRELDAKNIPKLVYSLREGKVQWEELREESKRALMNGMDAYCKRENVDAKNVSNMIYGFGNMGATIYNMPEMMKETLEEAVRKIARKKVDPQHISNIMYSFMKMQYSWEIVGEETREALLYMIGELSREFTAQVRREEKEYCYDCVNGSCGLSNTCYSVAVMIGGNKEERKKSYLIPLQESLLRRYYEIEKMSREKGMKGSFSEENLSQLSVYLSWLGTLPSSSIYSLLQSLQQDKLPDIDNPLITQPAASHMRFSEKLREVWKLLMEKQVREGKMSEKRKDELMMVKFVDKYQGLSRKVFPVDIAVVEDVMGFSGEKEENVWLFVEVDGNSQKHSVKEGNEKIVDTKDKLKEYLYSKKYKDVPMRRIELRSILGKSGDAVYEVVQELWQKVKKV